MNDRNKKLIISLMITYFAHYLSFNLWHTTFNNFAVELFSVDGQQIGLIQSLREIPGFLGFTAGIFSLVISEASMAGLSTAILGLGLIATGLSQNMTTLILSSILMSVGFHYFYTVNSSMVLMVADKNNVAHTVGKFSSLGSIASILAMGAVYLLIERIGYRPLYLIAGGIAVVFGLYMLTQRGRAAHVSSQRRVVFRKEYWLYYVLSFLEGSKKHISSTFSIFLLVSVFEISAKNMSLIFLVNFLITSYTHQRMGKIVDKFGERRVLTFYYAFLGLTYLGFGFIRDVRVVVPLFVLARVAMGLTVALNSYFYKIAPAEEITSNVSMRTTIDHVAAIFIPLIGGFLWKAIGPEATYLMGVGIVAAALVFTRFLKAQAIPQSPSEAA